MTDTNGKFTNAPEPDRHELSAELAMGGQALIEGVMMRSPTRIAMAARKPDGGIVVRCYPYVGIGKRIKWLGWPVIRGAAGMIEALKIGTDALNWSAQQQMTGDEQLPDHTSWKHRALTMLSLAAAFGFGLVLFMYFPYWVARWTLGADGSQLPFHLIAGGIRITILLVYLWAISRWKEIHRVFQYHGSEHKTIVAFEEKIKLDPDAVNRRTRFHPRCGTSFLLIVALSAIIFFVIVDSLVVALFGQYPNVLVRFLVHLPLIPLVAGLSYEFLKFSARHVENRLVWALIQPGLWLQRITTQEPTPEMCEVAIVSLETALTGASDRLGVAAAAAPAPATA
ncbi:DUF1385 domain-containing protein [candidate division KSB1 bacterium]|nr:DUF1385 domain-containing protein [candidate division KSB1 bacterium]